MAGILISLLLSLLVWSLLDTRRRALELGWRMSRRYRESEERFRALNEMMPALVLLADVEDGRITYVNQAGRSLLGDPLDRRCTCRDCSRMRSGALCWCSRACPAAAMPRRCCAMARTAGSGPACRFPGSIWMVAINW